MQHPTSILRSALNGLALASNCLACHSGADRGQFDDDNLRMPAGLSARQRAAWDD